MPTILCLVGPPGVGKTSLGRSVARAMERTFVRVSLGGVRDEADIRGHRRTYIGAFPGRIIHAIKQAGTMNPVILLDEIDKMSADFRGDPAAAMLEVLDPEQNHAFVDHYLDLPYDLSDVMFITTGNYLGNIPRPLRDRMEIIEIGGYTEEEKIEICRHHLLPKQAESHGLDAGFIDLPPAVTRLIVRHYTREAGVRSLERQVGSLCRKAARIAVSTNGKRPKKLKITQAKLEEFLGPPRFGTDHDLRENQIGVAIGLCVSEVAGGDILPVEVATMPGNGHMTITGRAGDVMQESARAAQSYARSRSAALHIDAEFQRSTDVHIHLPEGATPKDGPSAGVTMVTALVSALTKRPVRHDVAMTGEITLRGRIMAIGGLKEKVLAAHRLGIRTVIAPSENRSDAVKIPKDILRDMNMVWVSHMDEVIAAALVFDTPPALPETDLAVLPVTEDAVIPPEPPRIEIVEDIAIVGEEPQ
jgi:ATP-dependent Lon protease